MSPSLYNLTNKHLCIVSVFCLTGLFPNLSTAQKASSTSVSGPSKTNYPRYSEVQKTVHKMSLEEKVGQLFIIGFPQKTMDEKVLLHLKKFHFSSFLLFKRNLANEKQIRLLTNNLKSNAWSSQQYPPIIALDQEGGFVSRLNINPRQPHPSLIGFVGSSSLAERLGFEVGSIMKRLGFNMNLAPVLDLADPRAATFIGLRAYGSDPRTVADLGYSYSNGLLKAGIIPTAKHFPGLGGIKSDPHFKSIVRTDSIKTLISRDLVPFKKYAELGPNTSVMLSHIVYPALDEKSLPASFSSKIIRGWLRNQTGFEGLVMTDDLHMKSSAEAYSLSDGAIKSLSAGTDLIMLSWSFREQESTYLAVLEAYKRKVLSIKDLNSKVERILSVKKFLAEFQENDVLSERQLASVHNEDSATNEDKSANEVDSTKVDAPPANLISEEFEKIYLEAFNKQLNSIELGLKKNERLCLYTSHSEFLKQVEKAKPARLRLFKIQEKTSEKVLLQSLKNNGCIYNFVTLGSKKEAMKIAAIPAISQKKIIVINFGLTNLFRWGRPFKAIVHFFGRPDQMAPALRSYFSSVYSDSQGTAAKLYWPEDQWMSVLEPTHEFDVQIPHHSIIQ
jgi:beta-N-acetylhexosaminidase